MEDSEDDSPSYAQDEPSCDSFSPSDSALAYDTNPSADLNDSTASGMETVMVEAAAPAEEEQNVYIPPRSAEPQTVAEIDWPAEAAPSGRYARRTTTSVIAHGGPPELIERESTPESAITSAVAVAKPLVPIRRPQAHSQRHDTTSVSVSQERTTHSDDTAALMKIERLPAVK